jgi:hypothetical protein
MTRRRWVLAWALAVTVGTGVLTVPLIRDALADGAARRVVLAWRDQSVLDDARAELIRTVGQRVGMADGDVLRAATRAADRAEMAALRRIAQRLEGDHTWTADVGAAQDAALRAVEAHVRVLAEDVATDQPDAGSLFDSTLAALETRADQLVAAVARAHGVPARPAAAVHLPSPSAELARLEAPLDVDVDLMLLVREGTGLWEYDLRTGDRSRLAAVAGRVRPDAPLSARPVGEGLLLVRRGGFQLVSRDGDVRGRHVPGDPSLLEADPTGFWLLDWPRVRRFDPAGHPVGPWYGMPAESAQPIAASSHGIVVQVLFGPPSETGAFTAVQGQIVLWEPASGRIVPLGPSCRNSQAVASVEVLVTLSCGRRGKIMVHDAATGAVVRELDRPRGTNSYAADLSPDGRLVVLQRWETDRGQLLLDLRTGDVVTFAPRDVVVRAWSPDARWLVVERITQPAGARWDTLGLWDVRTRRLYSLRLHVNPASQRAVALLPLSPSGR